MGLILISLYGTKNRCHKIIRIKRENWKGKFRIVAREKGRLISWAKWKRNFQLQRARSIFKRNNSFKKDVVRTKLTNVSEVVDFSDMPRKPSRLQTAKVQYFIEGFDKKHGIKISARSRQADLDTPKGELKNEALENFFMRYSQARGAEYDADIGEKMFDDANAAITRQGFVYYTRLAAF